MPCIRAPDTASGRADEGAEQQTRQADVEQHELARGRWWRRAGR
jgi:hypothetical protein